MRLAIAQINPTVGDIAGNAVLIRPAILQAREERADALLLSELVLTGYTPKDLLWQEGFLESVVDAAKDLASEAIGVTVILGSPWPADPAEPRRDIRNSALVLRDGAIVARYDKRLLPNYDVFDEQRHFTSGQSPLVLDIAGRRIGIAICEDIWKAEDARKSSRYEREPDPLAELKDAGAEALLVPSASPFGINKWRRQRALLRSHVDQLRVPVATVNQLGATDDLIYDASALVVAPSDSGAIITAAGAPFEDDFLLTELFPGGASAVADPLEAADSAELLFNALRLGVRDYVRKTGFSRIVLGLSGGIDSAVTACIAVAALGTDDVTTIGMPSRFSSEGSITDARELAHRLGCRFVVTPIGEMHSAAEATLDSALRAECLRLGIDPSPGVAEENMQSRLRAVTVMAYANKTHALTLATGNKSETATGYATLYGDMSGGLAVLSDVLKTQLYALADWINANPESCGVRGAPIPDSTRNKPPSAELKPDQTDQDTLPEYEILDEIIHRYVSLRQRPSQIIDDTGIERETVLRCVRLIDVNEYKRQQAPIGLKVTDVAFGSGRRLPVAQRFDARWV